MSALTSHAWGSLPRIADAAVERARLTVVPRRPARAHRMPFVVLVSLLLVSGIAGLLLFNTSMQQASFHVAALQQRAHLLNAERQTLQIRLERMRNPQSLAARARAMGMVPAAGPAFLQLGTGKVLGHPVPASPGGAFRIRQPPARKPATLRPSPVVVPPTTTQNTVTHKSATQTTAPAKAPKPAHQGAQR